MKTPVVIAAFTLLFSVNTWCAEEVTPEKKKLIDELLAQTGQSERVVSEKFSDAFIQQMSMSLRQSKPDIDPVAFDIVEEEVTAIVDEQIVENGAFKKMMYPIYSKQFSAAELKKIIEINNTELGRKMIRVMPIITQEGIQAGQQFGQSLAPMIQQRVIARFQEEGIVLQGN